MTKAEVGDAVFGVVVVQPAAHRSEWLVAAGARVGVAVPVFGGVAGFLVCPAVPGRVVVGWRCGAESVVSHGRRFRRSRRREFRSVCRTCR